MTDTKKNLLDVEEFYKVSISLLEQSLDIQQNYVVKMNEQNIKAVAQIAMLRAQLNTYLASKLLANIDCALQSFKGKDSKDS